MPGAVTGPYPIRPAGPSDLPALTAIERAADGLFPPGRLPEGDGTMPPAELARAMDEGLLLVATSGDACAGFAMARVHGRLLHLALLAVHPAHGRRGVGTQLVRAVVDEAARRGLDGVTLTTFEDLPWNAPFYAKLGFRALAPSACSPVLAAILAHEAALGMARRVAMQLDLG